MRRLLLVLLVGCGGAGAPEPAHAPPRTTAATTPEEAPIEIVAHDWATVTRTPAPASAETRDAREVSLLSSCGGEDAALSKVAREIAEARAKGEAAPDSEGVVARLRRAGDPHMGPRLFVATGHAPIDETKVHLHGAVCGVAFAPAAQGEEVLVVLRAETLADLSPLPTRARTGEWLTLEAKLRVPARSAKVVVLGPRGLPRNVPTSFDGGVVRARFALDQPGAFTVQLLGELEGGPKPLLEARVFADVSPSGLGDETAAPGEDAAGVDAAGLARMIVALRAAEGLPPLVHDDKLDAFASAHAERMRAGHRLAHDVGDGDFKERFEADGTIAARAVGENVAHAASVPLAHRALYASPSHRMNLLRADYTHFGVAVARAEDGSVYACETFLSRARP